MNKEFITLEMGSGGKEMQELIKSLNISNRGNWKNYYDDAATLDINDKEKLVFTTDSFIVDPIFFSGGNIGKIAACGTINDLSVMGATPSGLSLALIIEEGFLIEDLKAIIASINEVSKETNIPIVTGDTKIMPKGKLDRIVINTSGVGIVKSEDLLDKKIEFGDKIIISGGIGEHAVALLSKRFDYETDLITDSKPINKEIDSVKHLIKKAKDPTRGGIASILNEIADKNKIGMLLYEEKIPIKDEVKKVSEMLGINPYELACEGRFVCFASQENAKEVEDKLKMFNPKASIIGEITEGNIVIIQTFLGKRILQTPSGNIVPRIC
jgi:hydrogenase expression/formation protein HypE